MAGIRDFKSPQHRPANGAVRWFKVTFTTVGLRRQHQ